MKHLLVYNTLDHCLPQWLLHLQSYVHNLDLLQKNKKCKNFIFVWEWFICLVYLKPSSNQDNREHHHLILKRKHNCVKCASSCCSTLTGHYWSILAINYIFRITLSWVPAAKLNMISFIFPHFTRLSWNKKMVGKLLANFGNHFPINNFVVVPMKGNSMSKFCCIVVV